MQQTAKYKLNKPGVDDPIAIAPLNENADKLEAALLAEAGARSSGDSALLGRIQAIEAKRLVFGTFEAVPESEVFVPLDFTPYAVLVHHPSSSTGYAALALTGQQGCGTRIVDNGFRVYGGNGFTPRSGTHTYFALG